MIEGRFQERHRLDRAARNSVELLLRERIAGRPEVVFAYVHGSFVKESDFRDIDVAVYVVRKVDALSFESDLSLELLESIGLPVEVRVVNGAPVAFQMAVLRDGWLLA